MTTPRDSATVEGRLSWLEGAYTQVNERLGALERGQETLRVELRAEIAALRDDVNRLRADMNRQMLIAVGVLGGLMALFRFVG